LVFDIKARAQLTILENRVLRRAFGPRKDEVTGG
jgi:hypothetical protein